MMRRLFYALFFLGLTSQLSAQEFNFQVKVVTLKLQTVDPKVFETLEISLREFLNDQQWGNDVFEQEERIKCNLILTIQEELSPTSFKADLAIQSSRPIYGTDAQTPLINHIDKDVVFEYEQYQPLQFSRNRFNDNLSHILAYYAHILLGMDYDSFSPLGGERYFRLAQEILNIVPQSATAVYPGWRSTEGNRNRYWLIENILNPRVRPFRQATYDYHRQGLDLMASNPDGGRALITQAIEDISTVNQAYRNAMIIQMFNDTKALEIIEIYKQGTLEEQNKVIRIMRLMDPANAPQYAAIK
ncbi:MAG: DUF4835 family protein [Saprospiraceae bacterium]